MPKLTDTQLVILPPAAQRDDSAVLPLPKSLRVGAVEPLPFGAEIPDRQFRKPCEEGVDLRRPGGGVCCRGTGPARVARPV